MNKIRRANQRDVSEIVSLVHAAFEPYVDRIGRVPAPMEADYVALVDQHDVLVSEDETGIVGVLILIRKPDHLLLETVAVRTDVQGRGIGAYMLEHAYTRARDLGVHEIRLYTNEKMFENLAYYPRHGFVQTGTAIEDGFHRVYFSRTLSEQE